MTGTVSVNVGDRMIAGYMNEDHIRKLQALPGLRFFLIKIILSKLYVYNFDEMYIEYKNNA